MNAFYLLDIPNFDADQVVSKYSISVSLYYDLLLD